MRINVTFDDMSGAVSTSCDEDVFVGDPLNKCVSLRSYLLRTFDLAACLRNSFELLTRFL